jgi:hypothetical protein
MGLYISTSARKSNRRKRKRDLEGRDKVAVAFNGLEMLRKAYIGYKKGKKTSLIKISML